MATIFAILKIYINLFNQTLTGYSNDWVSYSVLDLSQNEALEKHYYL
jgi:hypothetical protein